MINGQFWINTQDSPFVALGKIPIKYNSNVGSSIFYKQYFEEMLFNYMDSLNTFYVATTRAIQHLFILAPSFKENVDKKTGEILGYDKKNEYIRDILYQVLDERDAPFALEANRLLIDNNAPLPDEPLPLEMMVPSESSKIRHERIALTVYPISQELQKA
ncbi:hypothetical protein, partial [Kitasatospora cinereorecta]|uniref:hypothetical protein n=1 Tax=Kitasatospora cinereorecta TaxID=285560 RepID=UPI0031F79A03